jgi:hypothetical protein
MSEKKFLHVAFNFRSGKDKVAEMEPVFNKALDWYRYAFNCWILWSNSTPQQWHERIKPAVADDDTYFICEIDVNNRSGWLPQGAWDWLRKERK